MRKKYITPSMKVAEAKFHEALLLVISVDTGTQVSPKNALSKGDNGEVVDEEW